MHSFENESAWTRFWHEPLRAERLATARIFLGLALLADQFIQYLPNLWWLFGPEGIAHQGLTDDWMMTTWRWTLLVFNSDDMNVVRLWFAVWVTVTALWVVGWQTRLMNVAVWFVTMCFLNRNNVVTNSGDDVLSVGLFLTMLMPTGRAFSVDRWMKARKYQRRGLPLPPDWDRPTVPAWGLRIYQIWLCTFYLTTGVAKLRGGPDNVLEGTWWTGESLHYVLSDVTMSRVSMAELPLPGWSLVVMTYVSVWYETLFPVLMLSRWTRKWALWFGVLFHIGIYLLIEVGWFSFYTVAMYGAWVPGEFWDRWKGKRQSANEPRSG